MGVLSKVSPIMDYVLICELSLMLKRVITLHSVLVLVLLSCDWLNVCHPKEGKIITPTPLGLGSHYRV